MASCASKEEARLACSSSDDVDRYVCRQLRERRIMLGLRLKEVAGLVGVTCQQIHKYETGTHRIAASRLFVIAHALGVDINYFFDDMHGEQAVEPQCALRDLVRNFKSMPRRHQEEISNLARSLAYPPLALVDDIYEDLPQKVVAG